VIIPDVSLRYKHSRGRKKIGGCWRVPTEGVEDSVNRAAGFADALIDDLNAPA
jgi:hypothetical protein